MTSGSEGLPCPRDYAELSQVLRLICPRRRTGRTQVQSGEADAPNTVRLGVHHAERSEKEASSLFVSLVFSVSFESSVAFL